jgi:dihydroxyacetone kinase
VYAGCLETSLNAPAFSVSVVNLSGIARTSAYSLDQVKEFLDTKTDTAWEAVAGSQASAQRRSRAEQLVQPPPETKKIIDEATDIRIDPALLERMLRGACEALIAAEPDLTKWDTVMGDGDCGLTLETGAKALLEAIDSKKITAKGSVIEVLTELEDILEGKMGGTLGGILGIFFVSLRNSVQQNIALVQTEGLVSVWSKGLASALHHLKQYTPAKVGDRTVMDTLIPFAEAMRETQSFEGGVAAAINGAEATKTMTPRLGRATYVGTGTDGKELPPDPGAWGAMVVIRGLHAAM